MNYLLIDNPSMIREQENPLMTYRSIRAPIVAATIALLMSAAFAQDEAELGMAIAEERCSSCHAIGQDDESDLGQAPAFRNLHNRYPVEHLAEALAEGIAVGHADMPEFRFDPEEIDVFIAYLNTLEPEPGEDLGAAGETE